jgi:hypothetical protein
VNRVLRRMSGRKRGKAAGGGENFIIRISTTDTLHQILLALYCTEIPKDTVQTRALGNKLTKPRVPCKVRNFLSI